MKPNHYQELKQSAIADDVIELNFHSAEGYNGFTKFVSLCNLKDKRQGRQVCNSELNHRYSHLYQGYWYANSWYPLTNSVDMSQIKPDFPLLQLITHKNSELRTQNSELRTSIATPALLRNHPDKRYLPQEQGYFWGTRQTIISIAKALNIPHKLPIDENGHWHLEAISAMSPLEKYLWCLENGAFDVFAFNSIKYETPTGSGTPFIYLNIPIRVLEEIATEYDLTLPDSYKTWQVGDKWEWIKNHPQIPLFITEGIKKAASLISHGKIAIACFSITTHSEKATENKSSWVTNLKPELLWILQGAKGKGQRAKGEIEGKRLSAEGFQQTAEGKIQDKKQSAEGTTLEIRNQQSNLQIESREIKAENYGYKTVQSSQKINTNQQSIKHEIKAELNPQLATQNLSKLQTQLKEVENNNSELNNRTLNAERSPFSNTTNNNEKIKNQNSFNLQFLDDLSSSEKSKITVFQDVENSQLLVNSGHENHNSVSLANGEYPLLSENPLPSAESPLPSKKPLPTCTERSRSVAPCPLPFERLIYLVFDAADVKESSRQAVKRETKKIAKKLKKYGIVKIIHWEDESCKGIDDFIAKHGINGLNKIIDRATNFNKLWEKEIANFGRQLTPNIIINQRYLSADLISQARRKGVKLLCVKSQQNSGKSYSYAESLKQERNLSKNNIENEIKQDLSAFSDEQNNSHKSPTINQNNQSLGVDPNNQLSNTNLNYHSLNHNQSSSINENNQSSNINKNYEFKNINNNNQFLNINENYQQLTVNHNNQLVNITENNQSSNNEIISSIFSCMPSLNEKVKIKVGSNIYDSIIVGYNCQTQKYQCKFNTGFIERDLSQIIHSKSSLLPDKLITYALTHRQSLAWNLADKFQLDCYLSNVINFENNGIVACADSALLIPEHQEFNDMVIDEAEQVSWHLLASLTEISKNRITKIVRIGNHGKMVIQANGMITIFDADLSDIGVKFYQFLFDISPEDTLVVENIYKPFENIRDCYIYDNVESLRSKIIEAIRDNKRIIIHTSGQKESSTHGTINIEKEILEIFPELESKIYRLDKESLGDSTHLSYQILSDLDRLKEAQIVIASSSINTGVSLDEEIVGTFDGVFGIFYGNFPLTDFEQAIERYRGDCLRHIYIKNGSSERINIGSYKYSDLLNNIMGQTNNIQKLLQDDFNCDLAMDLVKYYCKFAARINNDYIHLKSNFISHLEDKGYTILDGNKLNKCEVKELKEIYQSIRDESENNFQDKVLEKEIPTETRLEELEKSKTKTKEENIEQYKGQLAKKYRTNKITRELIGLDREGYYPQLLLRFWLSVGVDMVMKRDKRVLAKYAQKNDNQGYAIDFNRQSHSTQTVLLHHIGLDKIIDNILNIQSQEILILLLSMQVNPIWFKCIDINKLGGLITETDVIPYLSSLKDSPMIKTAFKQVLDIDLDKNHSPIQLLRMILRRIGYNIKKGSRLGSRSDRKRYYYITSCISDELADDIFTNWLFHELLENDNFENEQKQVA